MNDRGALPVIAIVGAILIAAGLCADRLTPLPPAGEVRIVFETPAQPAAEPLFPGQPAP